MRPSPILTEVLLCILVALPFAIPANASCNIALWTDGQTNSGGNNIDQWLESFNCTPTFVTLADLQTPGFLDSFDAIFVTRSGDGFGVGFDIAAALNVRAYVLGNGTPGRVVLFLNDWVDDNPFNAVVIDPHDGHTSVVMKNAVKVAAASGHGYIGELNGAAMALDSNMNNFIALGIVPGDATSGEAPITCDTVTQIGPHGNIGIGDFRPLAIECYGINTTGLGTKHNVYYYTTSREPAVADNYPLSGQETSQGFRLLDSSSTATQPGSTAVRSNGTGRPQ